MQAMELWLLTKYLATTCHKTTAAYAMRPCTFCFDKRARVLFDKEEMRIWDFGLALQTQLDGDFVQLFF